MRELQIQIEQLKTRLLDKLKRSSEDAEQKLKQEGFAYLKLRDYQEKAIIAVESVLMLAKAFPPAKAANKSYSCTQNPIL